METLTRMFGCPEWCVLWSVINIRHGDLRMLWFKHGWMCRKLWYSLVQVYELQWLLNLECWHFIHILYKNSISASQSKAKYLQLFRWIIVIHSQSYAIHIHILLCCRMECSVVLTYVKCIPLHFEGLVGVGRAEADNVEHKSSIRWRIEFRVSFCVVDCSGTHFCFTFQARSQNCENDRLLVSSCKSVLPLGTSRLSNGFSWPFILEYFSKICGRNSSLIKIGQE